MLILFLYYWHPFTFSGKTLRCCFLFFAREKIYSLRTFSHLSRINKRRSMDYYCFFWSIYYFSCKGSTFGEIEPSLQTLRKWNFIGIGCCFLLFSNHCYSASTRRS